MNDVDLTLHGPGNAGGTQSTLPRLAMMVLIGAIVIAMMLPSDPAISAIVGSFAYPGSLFRKVLNASNYLFNWWTYAIIAGLLLIDTRRYKLLTGYAMACLGCLVTVHALKFLVGRARPDKVLGALYFDWLGDPRLGFDSFPSGHAASAFLLTFLLNLYLPRSAWIFAPAATLVALSRVALERHFATDILSGAGIAFLWVQACTKFLGHDRFPALRSARASAPIDDSLP